MFWLQLRELPTLTIKVQGVYPELQTPRIFRTYPPNHHDGKEGSFLSTSLAVEKCIRGSP